MNIVELIERYNSHVTEKRNRSKIYLIGVVNMLISELNKSESTRLNDKDSMRLFKISHAFYSSDVNEHKRQEYLNEIIHILVFYSEGENSIQDIEAVISKLIWI